MHILKRLFREKWKFSSDKDMFREYRIFVACEADEDVNYIAEYTGEDHCSSAPTMVTKIRRKNGSWSRP